MVHGVEALCYREGNVYEFAVDGVKIKIEEISGEDYMNLLSVSANPRSGMLDRGTYSKNLIKAMVKEPKEAEKLKLRAGPLAAIIFECEKLLGVSEVVQKNLLKQ